MNPGLLFLLLNAVFGVVFLCVFLPIAITRRRYARFVENHSLSLRAFETIKARYK